MRATTSPNLVASIKRKLSLRGAAELCGIGLPSRDGARFCSPFRPDKNPSCTIRNDLMRDWSRSESFDAIGFYAAAHSISNSEAVRRLAERLNITGHPSIKSPARCAQSPERSRLSFSTREPTEADFASIVRTRRLPQEATSGLAIAQSLGVLNFSTVVDLPCWLVSDEARLCAEARRLDGNAFPKTSQLPERKAHTLKGSTKSWPVGLALHMSVLRAARLQKVPLALVEGGPDLLAAFALLAVLAMNEGDIQPVAMLGTSASISHEALELIAGRRVLILAHGDRAGEEAATRWAAQLSEASCKVQLRSLPKGQDLNDLVSKHGLVAAREVLL